MVRLYVLDGLRLEIAGTEAELPASRNARLLLGLLAVERRPMGRSEVAGRVWPDFREDSARASLRNALAQLRKGLGDAAADVLAVGLENVALHPEVWTDLGEVRRLLTRRKPEAALDRCVGHLLAGFDDDWVQNARDDLRDRIAEGLNEQAAAAEGAGDIEAAIRLSRRLTALDALSETAHRDLIRRLAAAGDRGAALGTYERLRERLADELRVAPSAATVALVEELRGGDVSLPAASTPDGRPRVGRSRVRYANSGGHDIAYQRFGSGPVDLVVVPGWASNLDEIWDLPPLAGMYTRLGEFAHGVVFDKRGTGLSEPTRSSAASRIAPRTSAPCSTPPASRARGCSPTPRARLSPWCSPPPTPIA